MERNFVGALHPYFGFVADPGQSDPALKISKFGFVESERPTPILKRSPSQVILTQIAYFNFRVGEVSCPTKYFEEASTIGFQRSVKYGFGCLANCLLSSLARTGLYIHPLFQGKSRAVNQIR